MEVSEERVEHMPIQIHQGNTAPPTVANITIVIDVIRAFTVAHYAFLKGVKRIILAKDVEQAFQLKMKNPDFLLAGEVNGLPIKGFDLDNSPYNMRSKNVAGKTLIQKTTNGVQATLQCLSSDHVFVTGYTNAKTTSQFIKHKFAKDQRKSINIIASHPSGDDDFACAQYIKSILENANAISSKEVAKRIKHSHVAKKFFDKSNPNFIPEDMECCMIELDTGFVMKVRNNDKIPMIERVNVCKKMS